MSAEDQAMQVDPVRWSPDFKAAKPLSFQEAKEHVFTQWDGLFRRLSMSELADQIRQVIRAARGRKRQADPETKRRLNAALLCLEDALARLETPRVRGTSDAQGTGE